MRKLREELTGLIDSIYVDERKLLVFGEGETDCQLMLIGEAPGEQETLQGRPFVGKAGKNLDEFLSLSGIDRKGVYITNAVKFRPTRRSDAGRVVNRPPTNEEVELFLPFLRREIALVKPKCVATLGNVPLRALLGKRETIGETHGKWRDLHGLPVYPLYHPAAVIYNPSLKDVYREDVRRLGEALLG